MEQVSSYKKYVLRTKIDNIYKYCSISHNFDLSGEYGIRTAYDFGSEETASRWKKILEDKNQNLIIEYVIHIHSVIEFSDSKREYSFFDKCKLFLKEISKIWRSTNYNPIK